jgi:DNA-binding beta-propeller fold protein YncE
MLDGAATTARRFISIGRCVRGLYLSREAKRLFVTNRGEGGVSVLNADAAAPVTTWRIPSGGSP